MEGIEVKILELRKSGFSIKEITEMLSTEEFKRSNSWFSTKCEEFIRQGFLTEEDIRKGKEARKEREKEEDPNRKKILERLKCGDLDVEIEQYVDLGSVQIGRIRKELIRDGYITQKKIDEARAKRPKMEKKLTRKRNYPKNNSGNMYLQETILEKLRQGKSERKIAKEMDLESSEVCKIKRGLIKEGKITKEEIEQAIEETVLEKLKEGKDDLTIAKAIMLGSQKVANIRKKLIEEKRITQEEIEEARKINSKERQRADSNKKKVLEKLWQGKNNIEIAKLVGISDAHVGRIVKKLIEEGLITKKKIDEEREKAEKEKQEQNEPVDLEQLWSYLIVGYATSTIKGKMQINNEQYEKSVNKLVEEKRITFKEIEENREIRKKEDKKIILQELKKGTDQTQIAKNIEIDRELLQKYIKEIQQEEGISKEDILRWKAEKEREKREKIKAIVLRGLKRGLLVEEILQENPKLKDPKKIAKCKQELIQEGKITQEEIENNRKARKERKRKQKENQLNNREIEILNCLKDGLELKDIMDFMNLSKKTICDIIQKLEKMGKITEEEIEKERKERRENTKRKCEMNQYTQIKREIEFDVKLRNEISSEEQQKKIRNYIEMNYKIYQKEETNLVELLFLKQALQKVQINEKDIIEFVRQCIAINEYEEALGFIRNVKVNPKAKISQEKEERLGIFENILVKICRIKQAINMLKHGNKATDIIAEITNLTKDEINILKIELSNNKVRFLNIAGREKILEMLVQYIAPSRIRQRISIPISDLEMDDMVQQSRYRRIEKNKRDREAQIKQDSQMRMITMFTKLGWKPETIAKVLKIEKEEVEEKLKIAIQVGLIQENQLQGIKLLDYFRLDLRQWQL